MPVSSLSRASARNLEPLYQYKLFVTLIISKGISKKSAWFYRKRAPSPPEMCYTLSRILLRHLRRSSYD
jgi:hypothetical protein